MDYFWRITFSSVITLITLVGDMAEERVRQTNQNVSQCRCYNTRERENPTPKIICMVQLGAGVCRNESRNVLFGGGVCALCSDIIRRQPGVVKKKENSPCCSAVAPQAQGLKLKGCCPKVKRCKHNALLDFHTYCLHIPRGSHVVGCFCSMQTRTASRERGCSPASGAAPAPKFTPAGSHRRAGTPDD
jgi:hypothetical protein